jgi:Trehalose and maltose hydrolases (possible phosphorylases)
MAKIADVYFSVHPWEIVEEGFNPEYAMVSESVFSLGNEYMGVRGYFDEGYSGSRLQGSYINGVFERRDFEKQDYKGMVDQMTFMVNTVDWLSLRLRLDGETLDLNRSVFRDFRRALDLRTGVLTRTFVWVLPDGRELELCFERFLSMNRTRFGGQRLTARALNFDGSLTVEAGLDLSLPHGSEKKNLWDCLGSRSSGNRCEIAGSVLQSGHLLHAGCEFTGDLQNVTPRSGQKKCAALAFELPLRRGAASAFSRVVRIDSCTDPAVDRDEFFRISREQSDALPGYEELKRESAAWWAKSWEHSDILIDGDEANQQGIRFCIFQMHQTYHGSERDSVIGAKGLTGEAYNGNTFWDTETYCLNFYLFNNPEAAKNLLLFRYSTLPQAQSRARELDCEGAFYPIATIDGTECCNLWQHASLQLQASTGVAYGIRHYVQVTGDTAFLEQYGVKMLVEICRMLASRGDWNPKTGKYGYYGVMGPDEFQMMANNNCYTNFVAKKTFEYTLSVLPDGDKTVSAQERETWRAMAEHMEIPYDGESLLFEQQEGFFGLPHVDVDKIPVTDFPLYSHWSYDHIYRNDMIKQPDVLMMMFLYNSCFTPEQKKANFDYYEPRCIHESSLSPSVHSILASELGMSGKAYELFQFATRLDLDNYNRNTAEGLHTTSIAAAWMNIVYGYGGMRSDGDVLRFCPTIPAQWDRYAFRLIYGGDVLCITVTGEAAEFRTLGGKEIAVEVYGRAVSVTGEPVCIPIPAERRN